MKKMKKTIKLKVHDIYFIYVYLYFAIFIQILELVYKK